MNPARAGERSVNWSATFVYNGLRGVAAGVMFGLVVLWVGDPSGPPFWAPPFLFPIGLLMFFAPLGAVASGLQRAGVPYTGAFLTLLALFMAVGDPLLWALSRLRPGLLPIDDQSFFSLRVVQIIENPM